jgi:uncharacterized repeat protein (TIGR03847 family)
MAHLLYEFDPVSHITAGAIGEPGHRTFFIQAQYGVDTVTLLCEKQHVQALAEAVDEMIANVEKGIGIPRRADLTWDEETMAIKEPVDPLFRVGVLGLGYDANRDRVLLVAQEALEESDVREPLEVRFFATRDQMQVLGAYAKDVIGRGRPPEIVALQAEAHARRNGHGE